jgi:tetratricopeptide (TPR) repeat protein
MASVLALPTSPAFAQGRDKDRDRPRGGDRPDGGREGGGRPQGGGPQGGHQQAAPRSAPAQTPSAPRVIEQTPRTMQQPQRSTQPSSPQFAPSRPQTQSRSQVQSPQQTPSMRNFTRDRDSNINRTPVQTNRPVQPPTVQQNPNPNVQRDRQPTFARPDGRPNVNRPDQNLRRDNAAQPNVARPNVSRPGIDATAPNLRRPNPKEPTVAGPDAVRRNVNRPNFERPNTGRPGAPTGIVDQTRPGDRNPAVERTRENINRDAKGPNVVDRDRDRDRTRDPNRDRDRNVDRTRDRRPDVVDRDRDRNRDPNRNRDAIRRYTSHYGNFGNRPAGYRDFVSSNFNVNRNVNNFNQNPWQYGRGNYWNQNYGNDWGRSNWYRNFNRYGYANNFSPWWGVVPGLGWNWGGWGWGWGWPQWGWGYGNWGGYGYGYGDYSTYYGNALPGQLVQQVTVFAPTPEQVQTAQDFYSDALAAFQDGRYQEAIRLCQHAMVDNPRSPDVILLMAQSLFAAGEYDQAADAVQMAVQLLPQDQWGTVAKNYTNYYPNIEDYTTQLRALETASRTATQPNPALNLLLGYHYGFLGHPRQAIAELDTALDARSQDAAAQKLRDLFASSAGIPARTPAPAQEAPVAPPAQMADAGAGDRQVANRLTRAPSPEQTESATEFVAAGEQAFKAGKYREAAQIWQHALVDDPGNAAVLLLMAQTLFAQGRYADAAGATQMAMQLLPDGEWGNVIKKRNDIYGNPEEYMTQLKALEQARDAKPDDPALHFLLGFHYGAIGHSKQAIEELDKTIQLQPLDEGAKKLREVYSIAGTQSTQ